LFTKFRRKTTTLFLDPYMEKREYPKDRKFHIILSPSLYWVKKVQLPVKYIREVKKLLPSLFEDILPQGHFSYSVYKEGESYYIFAYEDKKIFDLLSSVGIASTDILGVYFAQAELDVQEDVYQINQKQVLYKKDDILIVAPKVWFKEVKPLDLSQHSIVSSKISLQQYGHIVDKGSLYKLAALVVMLILVVGMEIFITKAKISEIEKLESGVFTRYKLLPTMMQNKAVLAKYTKIYQLQTKLRAYLELFLKMPLQSTQKITLVTYKNALLHVSISNVSQKDEKKLFEKFVAQKIAYKTKYTKDGVDVEIML